MFASITIFRQARPISKQPADLGTVFPGSSMYYAGARLIGESHENNVCGYSSFLSPEDKPAVEMNREKMEKFLPQLKRLYYDPERYKGYLAQLGIQYPTVKSRP